MFLLLGNLVGFDLYHPQKLQPTNVNRFICQQQHAHHCRNRTFGNTLTKRNAVAYITRMYLLENSFIPRKTSQSNNKKQQQKHPVHLTDGRHTMLFHTILKQHFQKG